MEIFPFVVSNFISFTRPLGLGSTWPMLLYIYMKRLMTVVHMFHQAIFAVIDGHGGHAAADYVAKNLGRNIVKALEDVNVGQDQLGQAIRNGYSVTDKGFLNQVPVNCI